jgi:hypothetical protein
MLARSPHLLQLSPNLLTNNLSELTSILEIPEQRAAHTPSSKAYGRISNIGVQADYKLLSFLHCTVYKIQDSHITLLRAEGPGGC